MMRIAEFLTLAAAILIWISGLAIGQEIGPNPTLTPEDVVAIQLEALQKNKVSMKAPGLQPMSHHQWMRGGPFRLGH
jgi:hypothetical protein